jgi:hypothetical protein
MGISELARSSEDEILLRNLISEMISRIEDNLDRALKIAQRIERKLSGDRLEEAEFE